MSKLTKHQKIALDHYCRLDVETVHPMFGYIVGKYSVRLTINAGFE
jgi:hypothetical protein